VVVRREHVEERLVGLGWVAVGVGEVKLGAAAAEVEGLETGRFV
jgi:hypothetical protein